MLSSSAAILPKVTSSRIAGELGGVEEAMDIWISKPMLTLH